MSESQNYHFIIKGPNAGKLDKCDAQIQCRNGGLHVPSEKLGGIIAYMRHVNGKIVRPKDLTFDLVSKTLSGTTPEVIDAYSRVSDVFILPDNPADSGLLATGALGKTGDKLYKNSGQVRDIPNTQLKKEEAEGILVENKYFDRYEITGHINPEELDENSWMKFGFYNPQSDKHINHDNELLHKLSEAELSNLNENERAALRLFTSSSYSWINSALYNEDRDRPHYRLPLKDDSDKNTTVFTTDALNPNKTFSNSEVPRTISALKELTTEIDSALDSGPNKQRILYRGMSQRLEMFKNYWNEDNDPYGEQIINNFVDNNIQLGSTLSFSGYQSSSQNSDVGLNYAKENGLLYEIRTSRGLNITASSQYESEAETLLPRNSKYIVVGIHKNVKRSMEWKTNKGYSKKGTPKVITVIQMVEVDDNNEIVSGKNIPKIKPLSEKQLESTSKALT